MQRVARIGLATVGIAILSTLILATRCADYQNVFVAGNVYFTDADCYARMTRVRICAEHPGSIVRHHDFENFPKGTTPHTTAPLDYLILALSILLKPFTTHALDLAGACISPFFALLGGWFVWWWSWRMNFRYRWVMLILYAISPILVHGTELGRPDHQSLSMLLVIIAICAEWSFRSCRTPNWSALSGVAWALAIWVSAYEPLILFLIVMATIFLGSRQALFVKSRRTGWILFALIVVIAFLIERRIPSLTISESNAVFKNWARTIGELAHVSPANSIWLRWGGYLILVAPFLIWIGMSRRKSMSEQTTPAFVLVLLVATYVLTIWQARWGYFFVLIFALALPALLEPIKLRAAVWIAFVLSIFPILRDWDERLWPSEVEIARRVERRSESAQLHELALSLQSSETRPFLAPWWLSPAIAYWSGQPGIAGSSHESLNGIAESARFFLSEDWRKARQILENHQAAWVFAYDSDRVAQNSAVVLGVGLPSRPICRVLDRTPAQAPPLLLFSAQNQVCRLYRVAVEQ